MQPKLSAECRPECWVGNDVSQQWCDLEVLVEQKKVEAFRCARTPPELAKLAQRLLPYCPQGIILDAHHPACSSARQRSPPRPFSSPGVSARRSWKFYPGALPDNVGNTVGTLVVGTTY